MKFLPLIQQSSLEKKIENAPDNGYLIGLWIGNLLPFVILVILAYTMYYYAKKRDQNN